MAKVTKTQVVEFPWTTEYDHHKAVEMEQWLKEAYGLGGTQAGRKWFYRIIRRLEYVVVHRPNHKGAIITESRPRLTESWCVYFRDPADATFFTIKWK